MTAMPRIRVDDDIIERALAGDAAALDELVRALQGPFFSLARRMLGDDDVDDVVQDVTYLLKQK